MICNVPRKDYSSIYRALHAGISEALKDPSQGEPQLVANLVHHIASSINGVGALSNGANVKSGGVFVHATPKVICNSFPESSPGYVEIGDLLLLRTEIVNGQLRSRSALLLQAKRESGLPATPDNANQLYLYEYWPEFEYHKSGPVLTGKKRAVTGPDLYNAAKYLVLGNDPSKLLLVDPCCCFYPFHCGINAVTAQPISPSLGHHECFLFELIRFIFHDAGKPYHYPVPPLDCGWSRVIDDLVKVAAPKKMPPKIKNAGSLRGQGFFFVTGNFDHSDGMLKTYANYSSNEPPEDIPGEWSEGEEFGPVGISTIEFVVESEGEQDRRRD